MSTWRATTGPPILGTMKRLVLLGAAVVGTAVAYAAVVRRWHLTWGATDAEVAAPLPGDEVIPTPDLTSTRAITIAAPAGDVWPWLAQIGQGRGGFYSYDTLENLVARCDIHSADTIVDEWQAVGVGDAVHLHPELALTVDRVEPGRALVLRGDAGEAPYAFTWAFVLHDVPGGATRLLMRERYGYARGWAGAVAEPVQAVSFVMSQKMLRGIRDRAEAGA
jgi:hypothetical protein